MIQMHQQKNMLMILGDTKLDLAGGAMTGPLGLGNGRLWDVGMPTADTNGANKKYVDDRDRTNLALCFEGWQYNVWCLEYGQQ